VYNTQNPQQEKTDKKTAILLMTTAPPAKGPWIHGRKLPPIGLAYVAGALEKAGFNVTMLDNYLMEKTVEELKVEFQKVNPAIVGITCGSVTYQRCVETAKAVKEVLPSCKVVAGGWHPSYLPESVLQHPEIDYVVVGEGERAMVELATQIIKGQGQSIESISGVAYRTQGKVVVNPSRFIKNLDDVPFPARHLLPLQQYNRVIEYLSVSPVDVMSVIRGCPFNCAFCESSKIWGPTCRSFSPARILGEMQHLAANFGTKGVYFINDNFTIRKNDTLELCKLIRRSGLDMQWVCDTRVDMINQELLKEMHSAGCKTIWFGVESGSPSIRKKINLGVSLEQTEAAFRLCKREGIQTACSFLLGIPGETLEDMQATFKFARKLDPDWCKFNIFVAVPGSMLYDEVIEKGLYDRVEDFATYVKTDEFNYESLLKVQRQFHLSFNKTPKRVMHLVKREGVVSVAKKALKL
jgi:anaerobic magnesium-protoporphyrin IX monomethyl ester cyclase